MDVLVALNVKCPHCFTSLMDETVTLDNEPSIKVDGTIQGKKFWLRLASVWGSYAIQSEREIMKGDIVQVSCPHCSKSLSITSRCDLCGADKIEFFLKSGGAVHICSRRGCHKHSIEVENVKDFLRIANETYALQGNPFENEVFPGTVIKKDTAAKTVLLDTYCPHCNSALVKGNVETLQIINENDEEGLLCLSPYLNVFIHRTDVELAEGITAKNILCPECHQSLKSKDQTCETCGAPAVVFTVKAMQKKIPFSICSRKGCKWHGISSEDLKMVLLEDSDEW